MKTAILKGPEGITLSLPDRPGSIEFSMTGFSQPIPFEAAQLTVERNPGRYSIHEVIGEEDQTEEKPDEKPKVEVKSEPKKSIKPLGKKR